VHIFFLLNISTNQATNQDAEVSLCIEEVGSDVFLDCLFLQVTWKLKNNRDDDDMKVENQGKAK